MTEKDTLRADLERMTWNAETTIRDYAVRVTEMVSERGLFVDKQYGLLKAALRDIHDECMAALRERAS